MHVENLTDFIGNIDEPLLDVLAKIDKNGYNLLFLNDSAGQFKAVVSDGDIRRWLMKNGEVSVDVKKIANYNPVYLMKDDIGAAYEYMRKKNVSVLPIIDHGIISDIIIYRGPVESGIKGSRSLETTPVIIMAGGKGTRLYPYTKILPKPLIPIGGIPILDRIIEQFYKYGCSQFFLTINYKKEMIKAYYSESFHPYAIQYVEENEPLGTAGGIRLIGDRFDQPIIVTNCDILVKANYGDILDNHIRYKNDITIVTSLKSILIGYGVIHTKQNGMIESMEEKPRLSFLVNTGMYVINPYCIKEIPQGKFYNMTDLVEKMLNMGKRVGMYPISEGAFLDMGEFSEMKRMEDIIG